MSMQTAETGYSPEFEFEFEGGELAGEGEGEGAFAGEYEQPHGAYQQPHGEYEHEDEHEQYGEHEQGEYEAQLEAEERTEYEAAQQLLHMRSEAELERFIPLLIGPLLGAAKALAPTLLSAAAPLLQRVGGALFGRRRRRRPAPPQAPPPPPDGEEGFLFGGLIKKLFRRELEAEQEQFLGKILGGLFGEVQGQSEELARYTGARWYVRLARRAARNAVGTVLGLMNSGRRPSPEEIRRIVFGAVQRAAGGIAPPGGPWSGPGPGFGGGPMGGMRSSGRWERRNGRIVLHL